MTNMTNQPSPAIYGTYPLEMEVLPWVLWDISTRNGGFTMGFMGKSWEYMGIPSGKHTKSQQLWNMAQSKQLIYPSKNGDFPQLCERLPEGTEFLAMTFLRKFSFRSMSFRNNLPSGYLTQLWKMAHLYMVYLLNMVIFHGYVSHNQRVSRCAEVPGTETSLLSCRLELNEARLKFVQTAVVANQTSRH